METLTGILVSLPVLFIVSLAYYYSHSLVCYSPVIRTKTQCLVINVSDKCSDSFLDLYHDLGLQKRLHVHELSLNISLN